jgi:hypothetical protein
MDTITVYDRTDDWTPEEMEAEGMTAMDVKLVLPAKLEVCGCCGGKGTQVRPGIDDNGLSREDMEDRDFMDDYMGGVYDIPCQNCKGRNVSLEIDWERCSVEQSKLAEEHYQERDYAAAEHAAEMRAGC